MKKLCTTLIWAIILGLTASSVWAQTTIYLVRHAEKDKGRNPDLTVAGKERAKALQKLLKKENIAAVYATKTKRTMQTGEPVAEAQNLAIVNYDYRDRQLLSKLFDKHVGKAILVVGHSNTLPSLLNHLVKEDRYKDLNESVYDNLVKVHRGTDDKLTVKHLKYGRASKLTFPKPKSDYKASDADVKTIDGMIRALYGVISGAKGEKRNWDRFRSLMKPTARMNAVATRANGKQVFISMTPEDYIKRNGPYLVGKGFFEEEIGRKTERFGNIAQVFSTYVSRHTKDGAIFMRGINSIQLSYENGRWWLVNILWNSETKAQPIPARYIDKK
ncbi:phosphoglycerate mutase family protein [Microscilla marina]|uniref:Phosphoglycerate mutase family protein n=1 Tax=Microscilla marina ATCC 23134 TaxID=313606 RepID=A1ZDS1_MICM2|nr:phosphoglycerate mutase family protein [Microscilla marina]EAY31229.1 phosphoglycerate mutase family protein [Microscilla marina ATCC 23134]